MTLLFVLGTPPTDDLTRLNLSENFFQRVGLRHSTLDDLVIHNLSYNFADYEREDTDDLFPATFLGQTRKLLYQADLQLTESNLLSAGMTIWRRTENRSILLAEPTRRRTITALRARSIADYRPLAHNGWISLG